MAHRGRSLRLVVVVAGGLLLLGACSNGSVAGQPASEDPSTTTAEHPEETVISDPGVEAPVEFGLVGVEIEVTNAVAPFDHHSNVDWQLLGFALGRLRAEAISGCLAEGGFPPVDMLDSLPDREDPLLMANLMFPRTERLAREGFPNLPGTPASEDDRTLRSAEEVEERRRCADEVDASDADFIRADELYGIMISAWIDVLDEIDASIEVASLVDEFGVCLRAEGIPAVSASSELAFLSYTDEQLFAADDDETLMLEIKSELGKLYAECGRNLFETRERLRGERREVFLRDHELAIRELNELLYGSGG